ncbi:MAG: hypothetical protein II336_12150 [Loktanella sp.]|nr:hypothetical protein [Loktanella sp.]
MLRRPFFRYALWALSGRTSDAAATFFLLGLDVGEDHTEMFVVCNRGVRNALLVRVEDGAGQGDAIVQHWLTFVGGSH